MITILAYIVISAQIYKDKQRRKELELKVLEQTYDLQYALEQKEALLREVHHRTKNNMQLISSLINLEYSDIEDKTARMSADVTMRRIQSLAIAHEYLHQSENIKHIDLKDYIEELVSIIAADFSDQNIRIKTFIDENIITNIEGAIPVGLILNELVTNSYRYALCEQEACEIRIKVHRAQDRITVVIEDNSAGLPASESIETSDSLGVQIVQKLVTQLNGDYTLHKNKGPAWTITLPLDKEDNKVLDRPVFLYRPRTEQ